MNRQERQEIESRVLDMKHKDNFTARFYLHKIKQTDTPETREAMRKADAAVKGRTDANGIPKEPDYSPENLIRLGAKEMVIFKPYVEIKRMGAKDSKSHPVSDEHIKQFPKEWAEFQEQEHEYFRERRDNLRAEENRQFNNPTSGDWTGGVSYTPGPYTISFG